MIALDPDRTFWYPLDKSKPDGPALQCRFGTCRQFERFEDELNVAKKVSSNREAVDAFLSALGKFVVGSRELGPVWQDGVKEALTWAEVWMLCYAFTGASSASEIDLKNSESASPTAGASAETAPAAAK
jgi:hypothetical protein